MANLSLSEVRKDYNGLEVVHGIDLQINSGEFLVIVGPSGCGKSTLLRMIAGLEDITSGTVEINGVVMNEIDPADRGCAMVFQNYALYPHMTAFDNIAYPLKIAKLPKPERQRKVEEAAKILNLTDYLDRLPANLSGGQRQRVAMGRAMVREPEVFLFDEPLSNLDAKLRVQMRIEIRRLHKRLNATSIFVTHDQVEAMTLADKLVVMNSGAIEQIGTPTEVYRNPASVFVAAFLGAPAMNLFAATVTAPGVITLDDMHDCRLPFQNDRLPEGGKLTIGIRPEGVVVTTDTSKGLPVIVDLIEELGGSRIAYCAAGAKEVAMVLANDSDVKEGDALRLDMPGDALHFFDKETGRRWT